MRVTQDDIDNEIASGECDHCCGSTLVNGGCFAAGGGAFIELCDQCAPTILAAIVVDALPSASPAHIKAALAEIEKRMWRSAAYRLSREQAAALNPSEN